MSKIKKGKELGLNIDIGELDASIPQVPLQAILSQTVKDFPEKTVITYGNQKLTYRELEEFSSRLACTLVERGIKKGDMVALFLPNVPQFVITYFGVLKAGAVVTTISPLYKEREVVHQLCDSGAQTIVVLDSLYPMINKIKAQTPLKNIISTSSNDDKDLKSSGTKVNLWKFRDLIKKTAVKPLGLQFEPYEDLAVLQYTGGTTGTPKGVMLTHTNLVSNALSFASSIKGVSDDVFLAVLPLFHVYGMTTSMTTPISLGAEIVLHPKFDPIKSLQAIEQHRITVFCGSPTMYTMWLANPELKKHNLTSIRICISGASPLSSKIQKQFTQITGCLLAEGYGLTEASPVTHCNSLCAVKIGSIGTPLPFTEAQIVDLETGHKQVDVGVRGELVVRGPQVMLGYWQTPEETTQVLQDGWLLTGDIAYVDGEGYFYIVDRKKNLIKHKDFSVYPRELEEILCEHIAIKQCAIIGKPDSAVGEIPKAYVVLKDGAKTSKKEIMKYVNSKVATYKAIKEVKFCKTLPNNATGKILKHTLKP